MRNNFNFVVNYRLASILICRTLSVSTETYVLYVSGFDKNI